MVNDRIEMTCFMSDFNCWKNSNVPQHVYAGWQRGCENFGTLDLDLFLDMCKFLQKIDKVICNTQDSLV